MIVTEICGTTCVMFQGNRRLYRDRVINPHLRFLVLRRGYSFRQSYSVSYHYCITKRSEKCNTRCFKVKWNRVTELRKIASTVRRCVSSASVQHEPRNPFKVEVFHSVYKFVYLDTTFTTFSYTHRMRLSILDCM